METKVAFIGAGFSSLCLAALLSKNGYGVDIYEQSDSYGGYAKTLDVDGYTFTLGPRYLWDFGKGAIGALFLEHLGIFSHTDFVKLDSDCFDEIYLGSELVMRVPMGWELYRQRIIGQFPKEETGLNKFFDTCGDIFTTFAPYISNNLDYKGYSSLFVHVIKSEGSVRQVNLLRKYAFKTLQQEFDECALSSVVRSILSAHLAIVAETPHQMSLVGYAIGTLNYHRGSYYPKQHIHTIVDSLISYIEGNGGRFHLSSKVTSLNIAGGKISSLIVNDEQEKASNLFISNIDPALTLEMIGNDSALRKQKWYERSNSLLSFFIGCEIDEKDSFPFSRSQKWYMKDENILSKKIFDKNVPDIIAAPEYLYLNSPSTFSEFGNLGPTGQSRVITGFAPSSYTLFEGKSEAELLNYRRDRQESIIDVIEKDIWPEVRDKIRAFSMHTPMDNYTQLLAPEGHIYAKRFRAKDIFINRVMFDSKIDNLKFCSAFSSFPGLASCIRGACYLYEKIDGKKALNLQK